MARPSFIVDENVGKLAKLLRLLGFDSVFLPGEKDSQMVNLALAQGRIVLTRDTHVLERRDIVKGRVKALLIYSDNPELQARQVIQELNLQDQIKPFTLCLECNRVLFPRRKDEIKDRVPPYVFLSQNEFVECRNCHRLYWKGTHWVAMTQRLKKLISEPEGGVHE